MAATRSGASAAMIEKGRVIDVNMATYTLSVTTEFTRKPQSGISFATPYQHFSDGEGVYFMPEVGSLCWIAFPSDGNRPFVLAWASAHEEGNYKAKKRDLNPGDIFLGTRDNNFLYLRRGGVVQIGSGPLSQRMFLPLNNTIKDFCENYNLHTLGGELEWSIARTEKTTDGRRPATLKLHAKEFSDDVQAVAELEIGSHDGDPKTILSLKIRADGTAEGAQKISLLLDKDGNVDFEVEKDVTWTVRGKVAVQVAGDIEVETDAAGSVTANSLALTGKSSVEIESTRGAVDVQGAEGVLLGPFARVNGGTTPVVLASPTFVTWLLGHVHIMVPPGVPVSGPPQPGFPVLLTPPDFISRSLFSK